METTLRQGQGKDTQARPLLLTPLPRHYARYPSQVRERRRIRSQRPTKRPGRRSATARKPSL
jgi:hypothetical protein